MLFNYQNDSFLPTVASKEAAGSSIQGKEASFSSSDGTCNSLLCCVGRFENIPMPRQPTASEMVTCSQNYEITYAISVESIVWRAMRKAIIISLCSHFR